MFQVEYSDKIAQHLIEANKVSPSVHARLAREHLCLEPIMTITSQYPNPPKQKMQQALQKAIVS